MNEFETDFNQLIRARYPLIALTTFEEKRAETILADLCERREAALYIWSRTQGITKNGQSVAGLLDPMAPLKWYDELTEKSVLVLKDFHHYFKDPALLRKIRDLGQSLKATKKTLIFLMPPNPIPADLIKEVTLMELPLPSRQEISALLKKVKSEMGLAESGDNEDLVDAACGLTQEEIENVLAKSLVSSGQIERKRVMDEKRQIVKKSGLLEFIETGTKNDSSVGGMHSLRQWLKIRRSGFSSEARAINLPTPKGVLLVGVPGCGKSLTAIAVGQEWELPLIRLDLGRVYSGLVGSSESNIREALKTTEAVSPCILWIDEIEKGLSGSQSGSSDGGTSTRVFGTVLTWMQEKKTPVFVIATANDISQLPPEFLRKGRFDEIFFVDLPTIEERAEIFEIHLKRYGWTNPNLSTAALAGVCDGFSGAEIEQAIVSARFDAFSEGETEIHQNHILEAIKQTVPLSRTMGDRIDHLRKWATHRARPASSLQLNATNGTAHAGSFKSRAQSLERNPT